MSPDTAKWLPGGKNSLMVENQSFKVKILILYSGTYILKNQGRIKAIKTETSLNVIKYMVMSSNREKPNGLQRPKMSSLQVEIMKGNYHFFLVLIQI